MSIKTRCIRCRTVTTFIDEQAGMSYYCPMCIAPMQVGPVSFFPFNRLTVLLLALAVLGLGFIAMFFIEPQVMDYFSNSWKLIKKMFRSSP